MAQPTQKNIPRKNTPLGNALITMSAVLVIAFFAYLFAPSYTTQNLFLACLALYFLATLFIIVRHFLKKNR